MQHSACLKTYICQEAPRYSLSGLLISSLIGGFAVEKAICIPSKYCRIPRGDVTELR